MTASTVYAALGLVRNPFPPTPDAGSYFFTPRLEEEFTEIRHCIETRKGFALLTGEVGLGKSTMVRRLLDTLPPGKCHSALILNTFLQGEALLSAIQTDFGLPPAESVGQGLTQLTEFLIAQHQADQISLLVIDDAQNLTVESLELVRLLCNLETGQEKLLQILLVGQPELEQTLASPQLRQLKSRIVKHTRLTGLKKDELTRYFDFRVNAANASGRLSIHPAAVEKLYQVTQGNLRQVHLVLDRCLYGLASHRQSVIDVALIGRAVADLPDLGMAPGATAPEHRTQRAWLAAGLLAGTATVAAAGWYWTAQQAEPLPAAPANTVPAPAAPAAPATQAWTEPPKAVTPEPSEQTTPQSHPQDVALSPRQVCEQKLKAVAEADDVLQVQRLPTGVADMLRPSNRVCSFKADEETWAAWLSRNQVRHILTAQQATRSVQSVLKSQGLLDIPAPDGLFGPKTGEALSRFQQQHRLAPTGQPDELTFLLLENLNVPAR
ncbi:MULTISPECIES: ExeA family protein [Giesbergeria]|uniref:ExeA family protein n=1 Tax=Giesbergeria sinuosa TaxID=80883 RepID=A0ABV9QFI4_9BURK